MFSICKEVLYVIYPDWKKFNTCSLIHLTSQETNHLEDVAVTSSAPTSHDLYEVFGLKRAQVKYSQPVHGTKEKEHVHMPVKTKSVHREVATAAATKRVVGSSRMKRKNKVL